MVHASSIGLLAEDAKISFLAHTFRKLDRQIMLRRPVGCQTLRAKVL